jgi:hypothetical protein
MRSRGPGSGAAPPRRLSRAGASPLDPPASVKRSELGSSGIIEPEEVIEQRMSRCFRASEPKIRLKTKQVDVDEPRVVRPHPLDQPREVPMSALQAREECGEVLSVRPEIVDLGAGGSPERDRIEEVVSPYALGPVREGDEGREGLAIALRIEGGEP